VTRPQFHFTAQTGWINDPHAITPRDGGYDVFYQYVPGRTEWAPNCHWGHARGRDLFSLAERPPAILPGDGDAGIWTGSLVEGPDGTRVLYTSVSDDDIVIGRVRIARPLDADWETWAKGSVVIEAPPGLDLVGFRDPFLRRDPDAWRAFLGAGDTGGDALALSYVSHDLEHWTYEGVALARSSRERDPVWMGALWECPQIFDLDGRHVMLSSAWDANVLNYAGYAIGRYEAGVFTPEAWGRMSYGVSCYYAPSFFRDAEGRAAMTLWMRGVDDVEAGWAGAHSIPFVLSLDGDALVAAPHPDLDGYRVPADQASIDGLAADVLWEGSGSLSVTSGGSALFHIEARDHRVVVTIGDRASELPRASAPVRVVIDANALEVVTDRGIFGSAIPVLGDTLAISGEGVQAFALAHPRPHERSQVDVIETFASGA